MMWNKIANFKENLNQIALEVQNAAEELEIHRSSDEEDSLVFDRQISHRSAQSISPLHSSMENRIDSTLKSKGTIDQSHGRENRIPTANHKHKGVDPEQDPFSSGSELDIQSPGIRSEMEPKHVNLQQHEKVLADLLEQNRSLAAMQSSYLAEIKQLRVELDKERDSLANIQLKLQEEHKMNISFQKETHTLKMYKDKNSMEMIELRNELNSKISEIRRLQSELTRRDNDEEADENAESLKGVIATLEKENTNLKIEKVELEASLKMREKSSNDRIFANGSDPSTEHLSFLEEHSSGSFAGKEEMELSLQKLEKDLQEACRGRDKACQELTRLKQHLLDQELEESDKMDEDSKIIEELRVNSDYQRAQILHLENALKQARTSQEEVRKMNSSELQKAKEIISELEQKLGSCTQAIDAKNVELLNLQTALGQYYAESDAKERLERDFIMAREESAKLSALLKDANQCAEISKREKEELLVKLSQGKHAIQKLEEDNAKFRRALEQSMTRLNRMSVDSDYFVDRRIVIKLLVTYFQRNHNKEVLDLMVRMLGFSEEDKQRIGDAQQGKGVVRGVLGLPGRLVGGILGGSSPEPAHVQSENQSFSDLWVDFLLKETEEREKRQSNQGLLQG